MRPISTQRRLVLIAAFSTAFLVVLNITIFTMYRRAKSQLDDALGERLRAVAVNLGHAVEASAGGQLDPVTLPARVVALLYLARDENQLSNVTLLTPDGATIVDLQGYTEPGEVNPFLELDFTAVALAQSGLASYTRLYKVGDVYVKSAYAPVSDESGGVRAVLGVEAGADFFADLRNLARLLFIVSGASFLSVCALGLLFYRQSRSLDRAQEVVSQQENLAAMGRMVATIAHEIRNPLSIISASAERLKRRHGDEVIDYIIEEVEELNRTLTGYLDFAHAVPGRFESHSANKIIGRCLLAARSESSSRGVTVVDASRGDAKIFGDEKRLRQAILNVLLNALQATPPGGRVEVSARVDGSHTVIEVRDTGAGIDKKDLSEITKPFFSKRSDGTGLGLSIVQSIVDAHGGHMHIKSTPAVGTSVSLEFPVRGDDGPNPDR